jgi:hypothetical protein
MKAMDSSVSRNLVVIGLVLILSFVVIAAGLPAVQAGQSSNVAPSSITTTVIPVQLFDMSAHDGVLHSDPWPTMPIWGMRLWDSNVGWAQINTARGVYNWSTLDSWITEAENHNTQLVYTFGMTPSWASSKPTDTTCDYSPGACDPPSDLNLDGTGTDQNFIDFVSAIAQHAPSITRWEMWNTPHDIKQWTGSKAQLVRMTADARASIKKYVPNAQIISPANGQLNYVYPNGNCTMADKMGKYLAAGLGQYIDVVAFHTYYTATPENIVPVIQCYQSVMAQYNVSSLPLWSTEGSWGTDTTVPKNTDQAAFVARLYLLLWANGVTRHYWYDWNDQQTGTLESNGVTNKAGTAYAQVESWMVGRTMTTPCFSNTAGLWKCNFSGANGYSSKAIWNPGGNVSFVPPAPYVNYLDLAGTKHTFAPGASITIGVEPVLLQNQ